ncbi:hypothetical protein IscW_ISCW009424 [Ixodes scapularis]|uniref:Uncharacterized protein n=1 Tax=Ixodes scapularis TaxID=6945 RepID=B7PZC4_IXOSC|nr:hypothetical protein IscW_ISCW009424 [Ixodes scapularis]|eukprot:XP_002405096.1 hypothetical protein IscW_ISCW009424 [Ixodes scapularis]
MILCVVAWHTNYEANVKGKNGCCPNRVGTKLYRSYRFQPSNVSESLKTSRGRECFSEAHILSLQNAECPSQELQSVSSICEASQMKLTKYTKFKCLARMILEVL